MAADPDARARYGRGANLVGPLAGNARIKVRKAGQDVGTRRAINLIEGANVTLTINDDDGNEEVDVTIAAAGGSGAPTTAPYVVVSLDATLTAERRLQVSADLSLTDGGANNDLTIGLAAGVYKAGGTDVAVADGGTGASTAAGGLANLGGIPLSTVTTKGDRILATASATVARRAAPANGGMEYADSAQADGWASLLAPTDALKAHRSLGYSGTVPSWLLSDFWSANGKRWSLTPDVTTWQPTGTGAPTNAGSITATSDTTGMSMTHTTSAAAGGTGGVSTGYATFKGQANPTCFATFMTPAVVSDERYYVGVAASAPPTGAGGDTLAIQCALLRHSTDAGDTTFKFVTRDATTSAAAVDTTMAVTAANVYFIVVYSDDAGVTWKYIIQNVTAGTSVSGTGTGNYPSATQSLGQICRIETRINSAKANIIYGVEGKCRRIVA